MTPRILCIDDDVLSLRLIQRILRPLQFDFVAATSAASGISSAQAAPPSVVLMGTTLNDMVSHQVIHHLRQQPETAATPIVVLTSTLSCEEYQRCMAAGSNAYLLKPVSSGNLLRTLRPLLVLPKDPPRPKL